VTLTVNALLLLAALASVTGPPQSAPADRHAMDESIATLVKAFHGVMGVAAINLETREELAFNAETRFPTASTIKTAVMLEAYHQIAEGSLTLDTVLTLHDAEKVGGSGVLRQLHDGLGLKVSDLLYLMIALSDNTATNMLVARLGTARIDDRLAGYGFKETRIFRPTFRDGRADVLPELEKEFGLGMTTPREMARLMALIADKKAVSVTASEAMLATLRKQQDRAMIPRLLPSDDSVEIGNKTGTDQEKQPDANGVRGQVRSDAAIVTGPGLRYVIAIYTRQVEDARWTIDNDALVTGARISRLVYDYFSKGRSQTR
jgi:beta-lactamase class A